MKNLLKSGPARPALAIGPHLIPQYDDQWLRTALARSQMEHSYGTLDLTDKLVQGVFLYLEEQPPHVPLQVQQVYQRLRGVLRHLGQDLAAETLQPVAPPVGLSLLTLAKKAGAHYELLFFQMLERELILLIENGAEELQLFALEGACAHLSSTAKGRNRLADEIQATLAHVLARKPLYEPIPF